MVTHSLRTIVLTVVVWVFPAVVSSQEGSGDGAPDVVITSNVIGMKLARIPAGEFQMGAGAGDGHADEDELPRHTVRISREFDMGVYEVTCGQFRQFVDETDYETAAERGKSSGYVSETRTFQYDQAGFNWQNLGWEQTDEHPVLNVNWFDATAFCDWLSEKEGRLCRLPSEAEWEYACRAGGTGRFTTGDEVSQLQAIANLQDESLVSLEPRFSNSENVSYLRGPVPWDDGFPFSAPVGSFEPNAFGLYDMLGNAAEWCGDWYGEDYYADAPEADPTGPAEGEGRLVRGGAFVHQPRHCRASVRISGTPTYHNYIIGFRVVAEVSTKDGENE